LHSQTKCIGVYEYGITYKKWPDRSQLEISTTSRIYKSVEVLSRCIDQLVWLIKDIGIL